MTISPNLSPRQSFELPASLSPISSRRNSSDLLSRLQTIDLSISDDASLQDPNQTQKLPTLAKKIGDVFYEIFGYIPVIGMFIGAHHAYKAYTREGEVDGWEKFQIIVQLSSFLVVPQIVYGIACAGDAIRNYFQAEWQKDVASELAQTKCKQDVAKDVC